MKFHFSVLEISASPRMQFLTNSDWIYRIFQKWNNRRLHFYFIRVSGKGCFQLCNFLSSSWSLLTVVPSRAKPNTLFPGSCQSFLIYCLYEMLETLILAHFFSVPFALFSYNSRITSFRSTILAHPPFA